MEQDMRSKRFSTFTGTAIAALMIAALPAAAQDRKQDTQQPQAQQQSKERQPEQSGNQQSKNQQSQKLSRPDGEWLTLSGKVASVSGDRFRMSVGDKEIAVELDDHDWGRESNALRVGDRVTVSGAMDKDFLEKRKIEASSVYIDKLNRYIYASASDEESGYNYSYLTADRAEDGEWISFTGTVIEQDGEELRVDTGIREIKVDTSELTGPDELTWIDAGDRVSVYGEMDDADLFERREVIASSVVTLSSWR